MRTKLLSLYLFGLSAAYIQAQTVIETAHAAYNSRRFSDAISLYEQGLASNPGDMEAQMNLANAYKITNNPQKSALWFERVLKNPEALANYPLVPFFYGEVLKMLEDYDKAKQIFPKLPSEYQSVIDVCLQSCNFANANSKDLGIFKVRAEQQVNTEHAEYAPAFYKNKLIFASSRPVKSPLAEDAYTDNTVNFPYLVDKNSKGMLSNPNPLFKYNGMNNNGDPVSFTKDGKRVAYMVNSFTGGLRHLPEHNIRKGDIEFANVGAVEEEWTRDTETDVFPHFQNMDGVAKGFPCLTPDGKTMYFAANPNSGFGGFDIFVSFFKNGVWSEPQNLGANVNTAGDEICPFIASDGTLYFSSNFHKGFGGYDIYKSELEGKVWKKVRSLGKGVNSASDDLYFVIDDVANQAYFASNRVGGAGDYDIYEADLVGDESRLPFVLENERMDVQINFLNPHIGNTSPVLVNNPTKPNPQPTPKPQPQPKPNPNPKPNPTATTEEEIPCATNFYIGALVDVVSQQPIEKATIHVKNLKTQDKEQTMSNKFGEYTLLLDPGTEYMLVVSKSNYQNETFQIDTKSGGQRTLLGTRRLQRAATYSETDVFGDPKNEPKTNLNPQPAPNQPTSQYYSLAGEGDKIPNTGYIIQAGAFSKLSNSAVDRLKQYGNVMTEKGKTLTTYRIGVYADKNHAQEMLNLVQKSGYQDAWIITTPIDNKTLAGKLANQSQVIFPAQKAEISEPDNTDYADNPVNEPVSPNPYNSGKNIPKIVENPQSDWADNGLMPRGNTPTNADKNVPKPKNNPQPTVTAKADFRVQLGAFREPEKISFAKLNDLGDITTNKGSNGLTYFYLSGYETLDEAKRAKQAAEARGIETPFVVGFKNGVKVPLAELTSIK